MSALLSIQFVRRVIVTAGFVGILFAGYVAMKKAEQFLNDSLAINEITLDAKGVYAPELKKQVSEWLRHVVVQNKMQLFGRSQLAHELLGSFPLVERVSWSYYSPGVLNCTVTGVQPTFIVNQSFVAGSSGRLFEPSYFAEYQSALPQVKVSNDWLSSKAFPQVYQFLSALPEEFWGSNTLTYRDPYSILVQPGKDSELPYDIICMIDENTANRLTSRRVLKGLCEDLKQRHTDQWRSGSVFFFDFRFEDRIISKIVTVKQAQELIGLDDE